MDSLYVPILIAGFGGGVLRGIVGFVKHQFQFKKTEFDLFYFLGMMFLSGIVGVFTAIVARDTGLPIFSGVMTPAVAFVVGYASGDFIENIYKIVLGKPSIWTGT